MELTVVNSKRKILWEPEPEPVIDKSPPNKNLSKGVKEQPPPKQLATHELVLPANAKLIVQPNRPYKKRIGNGHKSTKKRDLFNEERSKIKYDLFLPKNGQIDNDDCLIFKSKLPVEVAIFQVTGYVSVLHRDVAEGTLKIKNLAAYENWMSSKYGGSLWARYNNPLYVDVRAKNLEAIANGLKPLYKVDKKQPPMMSVNLTPKFTFFPKKM